MSSKHFVHFWETIADEEEARKRAAYVLESINKHNRGAKKILELGVGIGGVLACLPRKFLVYGLDTEEEYIDVCREKIPEGKFIVSSMHDFKIDEKFDAIFAVHDSINFLESFGQWKSTFETVSNHLSEDGLFIFDMYTPKALTDFKEREATTRDFPDGSLHEEVAVEGDMLTWIFSVSDETRGGPQEVYEYRWKEIVHPVKKVKSALSNHFTVLEKKLMDEGRRMLFVCRRI